MKTVQAALEFYGTVPLPCTFVRNDVMRTLPKDASDVASIFHSPTVSFGCDVSKKPSSQLK